MKKARLSKISSIHYFKLVFRGLLFVWAFLTYITDPSLHHLTFEKAEPRYWLLLLVVWIVFAIEMMLRFLPSRIESMGCQKQFQSSFIPSVKYKEEKQTEDSSEKSAAYKAAKGDSKTWMRLSALTFSEALQVQLKREETKGVLLVAASWIGLNAIFGILYFTGVIDEGILVLISLFFSVSDMICILFFCPFQTWMMKNRCCVTCRIYNWDYLMMFTPLIFAKALFTWSLVALAILLLLRWEITALVHPERFSESTNEALKCANCQEKLCSHKKQLRSVWKSQRERVERLEEQLIEHIPEFIKERTKKTEKP